MKNVLFQDVRCAQAELSIERESINTPMLRLSDMLEKYSSVIWDCDGVILNSNDVKTSAFRSVTLPFGNAASSAFVDYHIQNGGISRYDKFNYFQESIMPTYASEVFIEDKTEFVRDLLLKFSQGVKSGLMSCEIASGLKELRCSMLDVPWFIVSGGDQNELREVFEVRGIKDYFNGGIYGSPKDKFRIVSDLLQAKKLQLPGLFVGDSSLDHKVAEEFGMDFIFLNQWTEYTDWQEYCDINGILVVPTISEMSKLYICSG